MPSPFKMQEEELIQAMQPMEHISELKLDDVAARLLLSKRSLQRRLHQRGTNWTAFKRKCQLSLARQLLDETNLSVSEVAGKCGFGSCAYFTKVFRSATGFSPTAWREIKD
ncbi:MAG: helix-turn-helix transcriptional regulator [Desulfovibrionaceae bacterium]